MNKTQKTTTVLLPVIYLMRKQMGSVYSLQTNAVMRYFEHFEHHHYKAKSQ